MCARHKSAIRNPQSAIGSRWACPAEAACSRPAISPADPNLMMINCDMSAAYISEDGGHNWRMIHQAQLRTDTQCRPGFHPIRPQRDLRLLRRPAEGQPRPGPDLHAHRQSQGVPLRRDRDQPVRSEPHARGHAQRPVLAVARCGRHLDRLPGPAGPGDRVPFRPVRAPRQSAGRTTYACSPPRTRASGAPTTAGRPGRRRPRACPGRRSRDSPAAPMRPATRCSTAP